MCGKEIIKARASWGWREGRSRIIPTDQRARVEKAGWKRPREERESEAGVSTAAVSNPVSEGRGVSGQRRWVCISKPRQTLGTEAKLSARDIGPAPELGNGAS